MGVIKMFILGMIVGGMIGGTLTLMLYACIIAGKESDRHINGE